MERPGYPRAVFAFVTDGRSAVLAAVLAAALAAVLAAVLANSLQLSV